jgi:hypothetical protein
MVYDCRKSLQLYRLMIVIDIGIEGRALSSFISFNL